MRKGKNSNDEANGWLLLEIGYWLLVLVLYWLNQYQNNDRYQSWLLYTYYIFQKQILKANYTIITWGFPCNPPTPINCLLKQFYSYFCDLNFCLSYMGFITEKLCLERENNVKMEKGNILLYTDWCSFIHLHSK